MKKISTVLLILVLVGSVAFAGFSGYARTGVGYDLDTGEYGFIKKKTSATVDVVLNQFLGEAKGEGDIYADIAASLTFQYDNADASDVNSIDFMDLDLSFDHAKIVGSNWYVGILNAVRAANFATSAIDTSEMIRDDNDLGYAYDDTDYYADIRSRDYFDRIAGLEFGYEGFVVGIGFLGDGINNDEAAPAVVYDETYMKLFGSLTTPAFDIADGLKLTLGGAGYYASATESSVDASAIGVDKAASAHAKLAFATDDYSASVAADAVFDNGTMVDVAAKASYDMFSLDAYYATDEVYVNTDDTIVDVTGKKDLLSAKVAINLDPVTLTVTGKDLINTQDLGLSAKFDATDELAVTARGGYCIDTEVANGGADVVYTAPDYIAKLGGTYYTKGTVYSEGRIKLNASVESSTIVPGATLLLAYAGDDLTDAKAASDYDNGDKGSVYAYVKIAF